MNLFIILLIFVTSCDCYKILSIFTYPGKSHFFVFKPLIEELVARGHEVTLISPFPLSVSLKLYEHIDLKNAHPPIMDVFTLRETSQDKWDKFTTPDFLLNLGVNVCKQSLNSSAIKNFMKQSKKYDLIILEMFNSYCDLIYVHKFKVPFIGFSSCVAMPWTHDLLGNPNNPSYIPNSLYFFNDKMTFWERVENSLMTYWSILVNLYYSDTIMYPIVKSHVKDDLPSLNDIAANISLLFTYSHFSIIRPKPTVPAVIDILGMHIGTPKPLPKVILVI